MRANICAGWTKSPVNWDKCIKQCIILSRFVSWFLAGNMEKNWSHGRYSSGGCTLFRWADDRMTYLMGSALLQWSFFSYLMNLGFVLSQFHPSKNTILPQENLIKQLVVGIIGAENHKLVISNFNYEHHEGRLWAALILLLLPPHREM